MAENKRTVADLSELRIDKAVPYSVEAEQAVLGSILIDPNLILNAATELIPDSFYIQRHRDIFESMTELSNRSLPVEGLVLLETLREKGLFRDEEDKAYLLSLADAASTITKIDYFINIVKEKYTLRCIIKTCAEISDMCYDQESSELILDAASTRMSKIQKGDFGKEMRSLQSLVKSEMDRLDDMQHDTTGKYEPIRIGIGDFDNFIGGLNKTDLVVLAARPGVGKTSFALNVAYNIATSKRYNPQKSIVFFSLEMSNEQLARRVISSALSIDSEDLRSGKISDEQWNELYTFQRRTLAGTNLIFNEAPGITVADMKAKLRGVRNLGMVVIDYLQLMGSGNSMNRVNEISDITRSIKLMAKELDVPVMLLSQLSRGITKRDDKTPQLSDLRDSGSIEQDADVVIFLDRPETYDKTDVSKRNLCEVYIQKNRHGATGKITLFWDGKHTSFKAQERKPMPDIPDM